MHMNSGSKTFLLTLSGLFASLTAAGAFVRIPFFPVPITLQSLFTLLAGNLLTPYYACMSQLVYLIAGLLGLPIFANGGGAGYVFQPTFGYLLGLPLVAFLLAKFHSRLHKPHLTALIIINFFAAVLILIIGAAWLYATSRLEIGKNISFSQAISTGLLLFLPGDMVKAVIVAFLKSTIIRHNLQIRKG
jgi:biotin transport system substrate-specific component